MHHDTRLQVAANQPQYGLIRYPLAQAIHEHVVVDSIEEFLQINVYDGSVSRLHVLLRSTDRIERTPVGPKAVGVLRDPRIEQGLQHLPQRLLDEPIRYRRYTQLAHSAIRFRNLHAPYRLWPVG